MKAEHQNELLAPCPSCGEHIWWDEDNQCMVYTCDCSVGLALGQIIDIMA